MVRLGETEERRTDVLEQYSRSKTPSSEMGLPPLGAKEAAVDVISTLPKEHDENIRPRSVTEKGGPRREALRKAQQQDDDCQHLLKTLKSEAPDKNWHRDHEFRLAPDGVLEEITCDLTGEIIYKTVLPQTITRQAVQDAHAGHLKTQKTLDKLRTNFN